MIEETRDQLIKAIAKGDFEMVKKLRLAILEKKGKVRVLDSFMDCLKATSQIDQDGNPVSSFPDDVEVILTGQAKELFDQLL